VVRPDLAEHTGADAVVWPSETVAYKVCRSVWRAPIAQAVMGPVLRTELGVRARQQVQRMVALRDRSGRDGCAP
jgi:hypothetical protein